MVIVLSVLLYNPTPHLSRMAIGKPVHPSACIAVIWCSSVSSVRLHAIKNKPIQAPSGRAGFLFCLLPCGTPHGCSFLLFDQLTFNGKKAKPLPVLCSLLSSTQTHPVAHLHRCSLSGWLRTELAGASQCLSRLLREITALGLIGCMKTNARWLFHFCD